jgi:hypothetical protein
LSHQSFYDALKLTLLGAAGVLGKKGPKTHRLCCDRNPTYRRNGDIQNLTKAELWFPLLLRCVRITLTG